MQTSETTFGRVRPLLGVVRRGKALTKPVAMLVLGAEGFSPLAHAAITLEGTAPAGMAVKQPLWAAVGLMGGSQPGWDLAGLGLVFGLAAIIGWWITRHPLRHNQISSPGFEVVSLSEQRVFIPLAEKNKQLDFIESFKSRGALRLSANLNKVFLSIRRYGYLLEDRNVRNALLVNRRRQRRTLLRDGDILDLGDLTLLYRDNREARFIRRFPVTPTDGKTFLKFSRLRGPVRKGTPMLASDQFPNRVYYILKNKVFVGRSEGNDLIIKSQDVEYRHAKIERVGSRYKLQDLSTLGTTYVNNRRVEQRFLREGDEISFDSHRFRYELSSKPFKERFVNDSNLTGEQLPGGESEVEPDFDAEP